jgi:hypothetical protein
MRALDCVHEAHEDMHFSAENDEALIEQVRMHRDQFHPDLSDDDVQQIVSQGAYDE